MNPPRLQEIPSGCVTLADHEALAREALDANAWAYFAGAAADGLTHRANRAAWDRIALLPRVLRRASADAPSRTLLGRPLPSPLLLAPVAFQRMAHPDGELASAVAASAQGAGFVLSAQTSTPLGAIARAVAADPQRGPLWFQLPWAGDRGHTLALAHEAAQAGFEALVLTVDAPVHGVRDAQRRAMFRLPAGVAAVHQAGPRAPSIAQLRARALAWDDVDWLRGRIGLPLLLKGVLHPDDAALAAGLGVDALIVSNHGGRTLDTAIASATALPQVVAAVGARMPVLVDGGIRRGTDVLKALALGASAVLIGRPALFGLAHAGAAGVAHVLRLLQDEFDAALTLCGCAGAADIGPGLLAPGGGNPAD